MVNLLKDYMGRGASHARAYIHGDLVVVVLHRTMTKAERTLADEGEEAVVRDMRQVLKGKFREDANRIVGRLTGQRVSVFLSDHDVGEDVVIQAFVLEPAPGRALSQSPVEASCIVPILKRKTATIAASDSTSAHGLTLARTGRSKPNP